MDRKLLTRLVFVCVILALVLLILYSGFQVLESTVFLGEEPNHQTQSKTIVRDGVRYYPRKDITVLMILGINREGKAEATEFNHGGAVDMVALVIFDEKKETYSILPLNRDMMVEMPALNQLGKEVGTYYGQLAFAHTYGDGMEISCGNVRRASVLLRTAVPWQRYWPSAFSQPLHRPEKDRREKPSRWPPLFSAGLSGVYSLGFLQMYTNPTSPFRVSFLKH